MRLIMLVDRTDPKEHAFLSEVVFRRIGANNDILTIHYGDDADVKCVFDGNEVRIPKGRNYLERIHIMHTMKQAVISSAKTFRPQLIYLRNDPLLGTLALLLKRELGIPLVFHLSHFKEEEILDKQASVSMKVFARLGIQRRARILKEAEMIFAISPEMKRTLIRDYEFLKRKILVMPLGAKTDSTRTIFSGIPTVVYIGSVDSYRNPEFLTRTALLLDRLCDSQVRFRIVGAQSSYKYVGKRVTYEEIPWVSREEVEIILQSAWLGLSPIPPNRVYQNSCPTKAFEYLGHGIPVVANREIPMHEKLLSKSRGGVLCKYDVEEFASSIVGLLSNRAKLLQISENGYSYIQNKWNYDLLHLKMSGILSKMLIKNGSKRLGYD